ncbi:MAG TPA: SMP-30/gluconolactonase/LRE family protein [Opitutaceae bacterium]|jgi:sugar lactone lactonase YvrE/enterochelin esterase-like enzyme
MTLRLACGLAALLALTPLRSEPLLGDKSPLGPDSQPQAGVPKGELISYDFTKSQIFPGTTRKVTVYVPQEYDPAKPACVYVSQDGVQSNAPVVFDNLIAKHELPVIVGVFVTPGVVLANDPSKALDRFNRSFEYDGLGDAYVRFLLEEVLPDVETRKTSDGRPIHLSHSGNDRAIGGGSSGAIAAFTAAWERPDGFSRVASSIGTYVGLRGGEIYPTLIRKTEPKPIRVFLQDGEHDLNIYGGDWWMANQTMERALKFAGYEVDHSWGDGTHSGKHMAAIFPDVQRWLWKDWPKPVGKGLSQNGALAALLLPGEDWQLVGEGYGRAMNLAVNAKGEVFFDDRAGGNCYRIALDGSVATSDVYPGRFKASESFGPDGRLLAINAGGITAYATDGEATPLAKKGGARILVAHSGLIYSLRAATKGGPVNTIDLTRADGASRVVDTGIDGASALALSPDQSLLYVAQGSTHWIYSFHIAADGSLADKQRYYWLHTDDTGEGSEAGGMVCDRSGWLFVATSIGIQVCDQAGRVNAILPTPRGHATEVCLGGEHGDLLFVSCGDRVYKRRLKTTGLISSADPVLPPTPHL